VFLSEKSLIARIRRQARVGRNVAAGIGDDCAVLKVPAEHEMLVTTDFSLEGVHFRRDWHPPESVGHRCLARGLSDIAAMGGNPIAAFLSLALPKGISQKWVDGFLTGLNALARKFGVTLAGGDTAQSLGGVMADIIVVGSVPRGKAILRSGARVGDRIYVTGSLGSSAHAFGLLSAGKKLSPKRYPQHFYPRPRLTMGQILRKTASSMIDLSDALSTDLGHICEESHVGAEIDALAIPRKTGVNLEQALHGGEDYELLFTASSKKKIPTQIAGVTVTEIGRIVRGRNITLLERGKRRPLKPGGWEHLK
jgi:thiamine-monophosphate kinase